jgi:hypothetical protein
MIFNSELYGVGDAALGVPIKKLKTYGEYVNEQINEK